MTLVDAWYGGWYIPVNLIDHDGIDDHSDHAKHCDHDDNVDHCDYVDTSQSFLPC